MSHSHRKRVTDLIRGHVYLNLHRRDMMIITKSIEQQEIWSSIMSSIVLIKKLLFINYNKCNCG